MATTFLFWLSLFAIFYAYLGYTLLLRAITTLFHRQDEKTTRADANTLPELTLIISVYNEENVIEEKLRNSLALDYPEKKREILVVSDASTDRTEEKVKKIADTNPEVRLLRQESRQGKTAALNMAVPQAQGGIIVFSDANSMYDTQALVNLARHFMDPAIGFVTGRTKYVSQHSNTVAVSTGFYTKLEIITKELESKTGSCVGADGAIFAIRKKLFNPLKDYDINDFVIPLNVVGEGFQGILDRDAFCLEQTAKDTEGEFNRQVRITCRTIRAIFNHKKLLNPLQYPLFSFELISHKLMKFLLPIFMFTAFFSNWALLPAGKLYQLIFLLQISYYCLFTLGYVKRRQENHKVIDLAYTLGMVSLAYLFGWYKYFSGETYTTWSSERP